MNIWKGEFADKYRDTPRLYRALITNEVFFSEEEDGLLVVTFYVKNDIQKQWIEVTHFDDFVERLLTLTGVSAMDLRILADDDLPF